MNGSRAAGRHGRLYDSRQLRALGNSALRARSHDGFGDAAGIALLAVTVDQIRDLLLRKLVDKSCRRLRLGPVHAHVEHPAPLEAETTLGGKELVRGDTQIGQDPVQGRQVEIVENQRKILKVFVEVQDTVRVGEETVTNPLQGFLVAVHPYKPAARLYLLQNGFRMTAQSESGIDEDPSGPAHQEIEDFVEEHRLMLGRKALRRCLHSGCPYMLVQARPI